MTTNQALAHRIQALLKEKQMTQYRLGMNSGVPHQTITNILKNAVTDNMFSTVIQIANGFDMTLVQFLNDPIFIKLAEEI